MEKQKSKISDVVREKNTTVRNQYYNQYVKQVTPTFSTVKNCVMAYIIGGAICVIGQGLTSFFLSRTGDMELSKAYTTLCLIFLSILSTGLGFYQKLAKYGGAGTLVPITGFANSVAAPAVEYKKEGQVFGIGCKVFTIAGPVILYGIFTSWVLGLIYYILKQIGIV
ncbi:stage V sporulation protein AC [Herbinix luporum]|mgnify:CR=1 FL=1|jgi:stage V sporulation protein AC|uniref:Putative membrane protein n=1 Tax=Herbinix luporum TaxID=1679721 RepID=A0A0K8J889_9FIRM|nr:stage V sporulation protein AC [Herbinix luporum]MDI9488003.1 stage V sporulation protein AC [Bacillota bacterium]CUH93532.1 putative membrane protein [Herbinix luporum]HHT56169.1 stage V sporulation protein AC [Herbinix luporum]